jgi:hypothetical protein
VNTPEDISEISAIVIDYGSFVSLAECLARSCKKVRYYSPWEQEFIGIDRAVIGDGIERVERADEFMAPEVFDETQLWVFPDIGYGGLQRYLRRAGKLVWGAMGASDLELYRTRFLTLLRDLELPVVPSVIITGVSNLAEHLKRVKNKWVKINRFRDNMETWRHIDWPHSIHKLDQMAVDFGGVKEHIVFVVQDAFDEEDGQKVVEIGYDGHAVGSLYPACSFQGYEKKNELYLGSWLEYEQLPEPVRIINEAMAPTLGRYGYRNFIANELRVRGEETRFIDPTMRLPGQTGEHLLETCTNLAKVIYEGAQGRVIRPEYTHRFAAEATVHYTAGTDGWKVLRIPEEARPWFKGYHYCEADGLYHFPPHKSDEAGVIIGQGDTIEEAVDSLKSNFALIEDEPVSIEVAGFADLLREIADAEKQGVEFTDQRIPKPESVIE